MTTIKKKATHTLHREGKKEKERSFTLGKVDSLSLSSILQVRENYNGNNTVY